jgi:hypothetical protein
MCLPLPQKGGAQQAGCGSAAKRKSRAVQHCAHPLESVFSVSAISMRMKEKE